MRGRHAAQGADASARPLGDAAAPQAAEPPAAEPPAAPGPDADGPRRPAPLTGPDPWAPPAVSQPPWTDEARGGWRTVLRRAAVAAAALVIAAGGLGVMHLARVSGAAAAASLEAGYARPLDPGMLPAAGARPVGDVAGATPSRGPATPVDAAWLAQVSGATGIPPRALAAYASAQLLVAAEQPGCGIGWNTLAGIGSIESDHGRYGGGVLRDDGHPDPAIRGIPLNGEGTAVIHDTDGGAWDGDTVWDRAVGPMQFIPSTWEKWGADGNGDGVSNPNQIDDVALAAARYLCASGPMTSPEGWRSAVFSYNHLTSYVDDVAAAANTYAATAAATS